MQIDRDEAVSRWDRRRARTYARLLDAGERLFRENGFDTTTVEQIAGAADVAKGTFFNYFDSKEALLGKMLYARLLDVIGAPRAVDASPQAQIWDLLAATRRELAPYLHLFRQMFTYAMTHPTFDMSESTHPTLSRALTDIIREGQDRAVFNADLDAEAAGALIAALFFRLSVLECVHQERVAAGQVDQASQAQQGAFCWERRMRAGLQMLYQGLLGR